MIKAAIIGATGYTGTELIRILSQHPEVKITAVTSNNYADRKYDELYPSLKGYTDLTCEQMDIHEIVKKADVVFSALPNGYAREIANEVVANHRKLIDLSADFRFNDLSVYDKWYGKSATEVNKSIKRVYGLPEIHRLDLKGANVVGNPGCYPTSVILGLAPALKCGLIDTNGIIIDSKSGVSGAGHNPNLNNLYAECNESIKAYGVAHHRHTPEIEQELSLLSGEDIKVTFTPHLVPMTRGILSTIYCELKAEFNIQGVREIYKEFYRNEFFVKVLDEGQYPRTKDTYGSNNCHIGMAFDEHTGKLIIISAIDNLVKGASGQAVQNMNSLFGIPENTGLNFPAIYP